MGIKIQDITSKSAKIASTDLIEIAQVSGPSYVSRKVTGAEINELSLDTTPQLGGNLDVNGNKITSASNGNVVIEPNGTGAILIGGNSTQPTEMRFMEDSDNGNNYVAFTSPTTLAANTTYTLPTADGTSGQLLSTNGSGVMSWATVSSGLTVGTTAVTSGTIGRIFFEGTGNVVQQSASLFWDNTNARLGVGATPASTVRLDVRAQGALSTDIAFRVRNSADNGNLFTSLGSAQIIIGTSTTTPEGQILARHEFGSAQPILTLRNGQYGNLIFQVRDERTASAGSVGSFRINGIINGGESGTTRRFDLGGHGLGASYGDNAVNSVWLNDQGSVGDGTGSSVISVSSNFYINRQTIKVFKFIPNVGNFGVNVMTFGTSATNTIAIANGVAPTTSPADAIQFYSADITAGNAAPHFRTENGAIVKVYQETTGVGASTLVTGVGTALTDTDTFDGYTLKQVVKALRNLGILA